MGHMTHQANREATEPHTGRKMSQAHGSHDRHAGHSVAMFRDKFWLSFALTIPVIFWSTESPTLAWVHSAFFSPAQKFIPAILGNGRLSLWRARLYPRGMA